MTKTVLSPHYGQKSFYGKAHIITTAEGQRFLKSYNTIVCGIVDGKFERYWNDYSATTMRHINAFLYACDCETINKSVWDKLSVSACPVKL